MTELKEKLMKALKNKYGIETEKAPQSRRVFCGAWLAMTLSWNESPVKSATSAISRAS